MDTLLRIPISEEAYQQLETLAKTQGVEIERLIAARLPQISQAQSEKPLVLTDEERRQLERLLARNLNSAKDLLDHVAEAVRLQVGDIQVELYPRLLSRLQSRAISMDFDRFLVLTVRRLLEEFVGLR